MPIGFSMSLKEYLTIAPLWLSQSKRPMVGSLLRPDLAVHGGQVEVELASVLRLELADLELHDDIAVQTDMVEEQTR